MKKIRCAIYTRKSSEEGLDQEFNSLDAQREACASYIASQKHEGWMMMPDFYDDGGISGGTLERASLQRLMSAVDEGLVDQIVVYKIDRLTRSLSDFAKLVDRLDAAGTSFVSVTQSFNTATSMGRLTLNMLLSFAQFEREVTAERIRDKIAASKRKGLWMGGITPLGYDADGRTLKINTKEAESIRTIFDLYLKHKNLGKVKQEVDRLDIRSKVRTSRRSGITSGGKLLSRGNLHAILCNPVYIGMIRHKGLVHNGLHKAIIDTNAFDQVQQLMQQQSGKERGRTNSGHSSPLIGKLFDETGDRLTPSHSNKKGVRHRYYVSHRLIAKKATANSSKARDGWRLPAKPLERAIANLITQHLDSPKFRSSIITGLDAVAAERMMGNLQKLSIDVQSTSQLAASLFTSVNIKPGEIRIVLIGEELGKHLNIQSPSGDPDNPIFTITAPFQLRKRGQESKLIIGDETTEPERDKVLIRNVAKAYSWYCQIKQGQTFDQIAEQENTSSATIRHNINLAFLAPDIVRQILIGKQSIGLTTKYLLKHLPSTSWQKQHELFRTL